MRANLGAVEPTAADTPERSETPADQETSTSNSQHTCTGGSGGAASSNEVSAKINQCTGTAVLVGPNQTPATQVNSSESQEQIETAIVDTSATRQIGRNRPRLAWADLSEEDKDDSGSSDTTLANDRTSQAIGIGGQQTPGHQNRLTPKAGGAPGALNEAGAFMRQARGKLAPESYSQLLDSMYRQNNKQQTYEDTLAEARQIFGPENTDLYHSFQNLQNLIIKGANTWNAPDVSQFKLIPDEYVGHVIGKHGTSLQEIFRESGGENRPPNQ